MKRNKDPWLDPTPPKTPTLEELHATIALQQIELARQKQIIALLFLQLSHQTPTSNTPSYDSLEIPPNVIDLQEWLERKYPF